jgi:hypothetical protein
MDAEHVIRTLAEVKGEKFGDGGFTVRSRR